MSPPKSTGRQSRKGKEDSTDASSTPSTKSKGGAAEEDVYKVPVLSKWEQFAVDHPETAGGHHQSLQPGARVMAQYGKDFYPAVVCG